jgi:hypothetical protein
MADETAGSIITTMSDRSENWIGQAQDFLNKLSDIANIDFETIDLSYEQLTGYIASIGAYVDEIRALVPPHPTFNIPESEIAPTVPTIDPFDIPESVDIAPLDAVAPTLNIPDAPPFVLPDSNFDVIPEFVVTEIGNGPEIDINSFGPLPTLDTVVIPTAPNLPTVEFTATMPSVDTLLPPSETFSFNEEEYTSDLLDLLKLKLKNDLQNGGYGIETTDETLLWERAREREIANAEQAISELERQLSVRKFSRPQSSFFDNLEKISQIKEDAISTLGREIAIKRADQFVQNRQFIIQEGGKLENMLMTYHGAKMERLLNASKYLVDAAISAYNVRVLTFNAYLERYKTEAQVFEAKLRANTALLDQYRTAAEVERIRVSVNSARIDQYRAGIEAQTTLVNLYRAQAEVANVKASIEKLKFDAFQARINVYVAQVQAINTEFAAYDSAVRGELGKAQIYESQVRGYSASVDGKRAKIEAETAVLRAQIESAKSKIDIYNTEMMGYKTRLDALLGIETLKDRVYESDINLYSNRVNANKVMGDLTTAAVGEYNTNWRALLNYNLGKATAQIQKAQVLDGLKLDAGKAGANLYSEMIRGALSAMGGIALTTSSS